MQIALPDGSLAHIITATDASTLFYTSGGAFVATFLSLTLLYASVY